jgi:hypothetical protein
VNTNPLVVKPSRLMGAPGRSIAPDRRRANDEILQVYKGPRLNSWCSLVRRAKAKRSRFWSK